MKKISAYLKCPRCDLNYIPRGETMCDVCKAELNLIQAGAILSDDEDIICPVCKQNYMSLDDDMCLKCLERNVEIERKESVTAEWEDYDGVKLADDLPAEDLEIVSLSELEDEEKEKFFEDDDEDVKEVFEDDLDDEDFGNIDDVELDDDDEDDEDDDF